MAMNEAPPSLPKPLRAYIALVSLVGAAWVVYLLWRVELSSSALVETGFFFVLILAAGSFPLPVAPKVKSDVTTAVLFAAVLLLEPGMAALAAAAGVVTYTVLIRYWGDRLRLPWYKYPFNAGATALYVGAAAAVFDGLAPDGNLLTPAVAAAAAVGYALNTVLITGAVTLQMSMNPLRLWWMGNKENGLAEIGLQSFGFLGAVAYRESPWTVVALFIPVAVIYFAFSRLARTNTQLEDAMHRLEGLQGQIANNAKLASIGAISLDMAHQLKNPLAILLGRLETLQDRISKESPVQTNVNTAMTAGWRIHELTQNFTSFGRRNPVEIDTEKLLTESFGMAGLRNRTKIRQRWECQDNLSKISGNPVLLREAMFNIFSNAMEAVNDDGVIHTEASQTNGSVVIRVSDDGVGIPQEVMEHLYEPFRSTKSDGSGLGIFATKHILEMHSGTVDIETEEGRGTSVTVTLPARRPMKGPDLDESQETDSGTPPQAQSG